MPLDFGRVDNTDKILKKAKTTQTKSAIKGSKNIAGMVQAISNTAEQKLSHHKDDYKVIRDEQELKNYFDLIIKNGICALDTETTGLDPMTAKLVGICLYTPGEKAVYVPVNHKSYITNQRTSNQISEEFLKNLFTPIRKTVKWIFHNAPFDIRIMRHNVDVDILPFWDTQIAAQCINENGSHKLKDLHLAHCDSTDTESLTFDKLFKGITFDLIPVKVAYLYAAGDAIKTFEVYEYQKTLLNRRVLTGPFNVFTHIEMPLIPVVCDMEDRGICLDTEITEYLSIKYHKLYDTAMEKTNTVLQNYEDLIENYKLEHPNNKLNSPINIGSPSQLATLFYDILHLQAPKGKKERSTDEETLEHWSRKDLHKDLCQSILEVRKLDKLLGTYIDKMPEIMHPDGRIHCKFNQYGAKTGRFSSSDPNMQNIPSHNKEIRNMFKAQDGYMMISADYSQQEPMVTSFISGDVKMQDAFKHGKDIYSTIASLAFHKTYEECLEFCLDENGNKTDKTNSEGKERRTQAKSIVLGILYGRQIPSIAEQLNVTNQEAQNIYDSVLKAFPQLAQFIKNSQTMAKKEGYVTTAWGRRRHLPDMQLPPYEFEYSDNFVSFDPLDFNNTNTDVPDNVKKDLSKQLNNAKRWKDRQAVIEKAKDKGIIIHNNLGYISQAERQCVNSRVQGSAADMVKLAMIQINNDPILKELDTHLIIQVHDEVIIECPKENVPQVTERLTHIMVTAPKELIDLPFRCDCDIMQNWYMKEED